MKRLVLLSGSAHPELGGALAHEIAPLLADAIRRRHEARPLGGLLCAR